MKAVAWFVCVILVAIDIARAEDIQALATFGHKDCVLGVDFTPDGKTLASTTNDGRVKLWNVARRECIAMLDEPADVTWPGNVAISPDSKTLATGRRSHYTSSRNFPVKLWDVATGKNTAILSGHTDFIEGVAFSPDGKTLASGCHSEIKLWDVATRTNTATLEDPKPRTDSVPLKPGVERTYPGFAPLTSMTFSRDGKLLAAGYRGTKIKLWDLPSGKKTATFSVQGVRVKSVQFAPNDKVLVAGYERDNTFRLWDIATGKNTRTIEGYITQVRSPAVTDDGKTVALTAPDDDSTINLWDLSTGKKTAALAGHTAVLYCLAFSPDGKTLASAGNDKLIKLWDLASGKNIATLTGHLAEILSIAFSPDGKILASGSEDHTVKLWDVMPARTPAK